MTADEPALELALSEPTAETIAAMARLDQGLLVLGAGGKMGPSLARLAARSLAAAGRSVPVIGVARFTTPGVREGLERDGITTARCDLLDPGAVRSLPQTPNLVLMAGQKFGTTGDEARTWAVNTLIPAHVAERFPDSRIVAFSTGNVYPLWPTATDGPTESDPVGPVGEYAQSALARERILEYSATRLGTRVAILRLNYAVEPRYGVLRDLADRVRSGAAIDLATGWVNLIWQRDANAVALRALEHCANPPWVLNLTGPKHAVRRLADRFGARWGIEPRFTGVEAETALLSNPARSQALFGPPRVGIEEMIDRVARWVEAGGRSLGKPTRFEEREGRF
jgi:nucleoside-diphosphate-sugar epimerase